MSSLTDRCSKVLTPFVNRARELVELGLMNAHLIHSMRVADEMYPKNWRSHYFFFAAQMYGAGKTRMGQEFIKQTKTLLSENIGVYTQFCPVSCKKVLLELIEILKEFCDVANIEYQDMSTINQFESLIRRYSSELTTITFPSYLSKKCENLAIFFHFDEIGKFDAQNLRALRNCCFEALHEYRKQYMKYKNNPATTSYPFFPFFYFSGRGAPYNELGSAASCVGSHWLILEPLQLEHAKKVICEASDQEGAKLVTFFEGLQEDEVSQLVRAIIKWTGGPPRPLLYIALILQDIACTYGELFKRAQGLKYIFMMLVGFIDSNSELYRELGPSTLRSARLSGYEFKVYNFFLYHSWQKTVLAKSFLKLMDIL